MFNTGMLRKLKDIADIYLNRTMLIMCAFGFASGFPFLLVFSTLSLWLKEAGFTLVAIGAFSLVKIPYSFKWLWSPIVDKVKIPLLWKIGRRKSWIFLMQILVFISIALMARINPLENKTLLLLYAVAVSFSSATLDIVLDAYRVECFGKTPEKQAAGSAIFVLGYRLGLIFSGAGALWLAEYTSWNNVYFLMSLGSVVGFVTVLTVKEPNADFKYNTQDDTAKQTFTDFFKSSVVAPFKDFLQNKNWYWILFLIFFYRMGDAYVAPMYLPFYSDMGFSKIEIAYITKIYGMIAAILGGLAGGLMLSKTGILKGLYICGFLQGITTLFFSIQALVGYNTTLLTVIIALENFTSGMATAALVACISSLCNVLYTATQYALLSSVMSLARDLFAATSGFLAQNVSWAMFFAISSLFCLPGILGIWFISKDKKT